MRIFCWVTCKAKKRETVKHKLKISKREIKHMNEKLTQCKDFVFADPLKGKAHTQIAHLQFAQADANPKIAKELFFCQRSGAKH